VTNLHKKAPYDQGHLGREIRGKRHWQPVTNFKQDSFQRVMRVRRLGPLENLHQFLQPYTGRVERFIILVQA